MEAYALTFACLLLLSVIELHFDDRAIRLACQVAGVIVIVLVAGLRWKTGNDWQPYWQYYGEIRDFDTFSQEYDPAFRLLAFTAKSVGLNYTGFLLLSAAIYVTLFAVVFAKFRHPCLLLLIFFSTYMLGFMGTQRQTLALGFTTLGIVQLYYGRRLLAGLQLLIATLFHVTAVVAFLAFFVPRVKVQLRYIVAGMLVGYAALRLDIVGVMVDQVLGFLVGDTYLVRRLLAHSADEAWATTFADFNPLTELLWFIKRVSLVFLFWLACSTPQRSLNNYLVNLYALSVVLFLLFIKSIPLIALRAGLYFSVFEIILLYLTLRKISEHFSHNVVLSRSALALAVSALAAVRLYAGLFLYEPDLYLPYKSVLMNGDYERFTN